MLFNILFCIFQCVLVFYCNLYIKYLYIKLQQQLLFLLCIGAIEWVFLIPSGVLSEIITGTQYLMLIIIQNFQVLILCLMQCISDSFYINITLHLTGQLKILKARFKTFASQPDNVENNRKHLSKLVDRHCKLAELNKNIEDTFHLIILFQLVTVTILLALLGKFSQFICITCQVYIHVYN